MAKRKRDPNYDPFQDPEWKAYVTHVRTELVPMMQGSNICMSIPPVDPKNVDVKFAVELGLMIMLDKPMLAVCRIGTELPAKLRRVCDEIVFGDANDPETREQMFAAMKRMGLERDE